MFVYGIFDAHMGTGLGVVADEVPDDMSMQDVADRHFIQPLVTLPREVPLGCEFLFGHGDAPIQIDVDREEMKRLAGQLILAGWEYARVHEDGGAPSRDIGHVSEVIAPGFQKCIKEVPQLVTPSLSLFLEGQHAWLTREDPNQKPVRQKEQVGELAAA